MNVIGVLGGLGAQELLLLFLMFFIYILPVVANYKLAEGKKRNPLGWVIGGMLLSWLSTIVLFVLPPIKRDKEFACSACGNDIKEGQKYCSHCGNEIDWSE